MPRGFATLCALTFVASVSAFSFLILPSYLRETGRDAGAIGLAMGAFFLGSLTVMPFVPLSVRIFGARGTIAVGCGLLAAMSGVFLATPDLPGIVLTRFLQGLGWGGVLIVTAVFATALMPPARLAQAGSVHGACFLAGQAAGPAASEALRDATGDFSAMFILAALAALASVWLCAMLPHVTIGLASQAGHARGLRPVALPILATFLLASGFGAATAFIADAALEAAIVPVSSFFVASLLGGLALRFGLSAYLDAFRRAHVSLAGAAASTLSLVILCGLRGSWQLWAAGALLGIATGIYAGSLQATVIERFHGRVVAVTLFRATITLAAGMTAAAGGFFVVAAGYSALFVTVAVMSGMAMVVVLIDARVMARRAPDRTA